MRLLLDTHVLLWWLRDDRRLPASLRSAIAEPQNEVLVSAVSVWEAAIKAALGRLTIEGDLVDEIAANRFSELAITARHTQLAGALPRHHDDPFDRMLAAQAKFEGLHLATLDAVFRAYDVAVLE